MGADLISALEKVEDEGSFLRFLEVLEQDFRSSNWENTTIDRMLEASVACARDHHAIGTPVASNPWRRCADILLGGTIYE